jgi:hypothetical protein
VKKNIKERKRKRNHHPLGPASISGGLKIVTG